MSFDESRGPVFAAAYLLDVKMSELVEYIKSSGSGNGVFNISNITGMEKLSEMQSDELLRRLRDAGDAATATPQPVNVSALFSRLNNLDVTSDGFVERGPPRPPPESIRGSPTPPVMTGEMDFEIGSYHVLHKLGGRAVCSIEALLQILDDSGSTASITAILPWFTDSDSVNRIGQVETVFSRQLERWWDFQKWQCSQRGDPNGDGGFPLFLEARREMYERMDAHREVAHPMFEANTRRLWQLKPDLRQCGEDQTFSTYTAALKRRLASHNFNRSLQLRKDPGQQMESMTWLEYLNFEQWWLEKSTRALEAKEPRYSKAWKNLPWPFRIYRRE
ncbi:hypothetical protein SPBR_06032 [Sporothrix brasiliensis 5110]|uniref:Uncharacterized protein n=1 Tax=Sporothrix brasiliensis 5110 TaxID=1398154 RepID=A0A0C2IYP5_9PEZI|nr:uncharacterized protein SPBR_06032 [Sporothrix brasiliensis 5110]KIH94196.1 hypothetical protein SPBR_06032 [Sporothrix brasiliensis 5110]